MCNGKSIFSITPMTIFIVIGVFCLLFSGCATTKRGMSGAEVINQITSNECVSSRLAETNMLITLWSPTKTTFIHYPEDSDSNLDATTPVQIGGLTASFVVPVMLNQLYSLGLTLDSTAIPVYSTNATLRRNITFGQLLLHHSDLPIYTPNGKGDALEHLLMIDDLLAKQPEKEITGKYHFTHWNYTLAAEAIRARQKGLPQLRPPLAYSDRIPDSTRAALATTQARLETPRENQHPELFALSTAAIANTNDLVALLDSMDTANLDALDELPSMKESPNTMVVPGWFKIYLKNGQPVYLNGGRTRRHGASVVYYPYTQTGVIAIATDSKQLDCLVLDILRNLNQNWKRNPNQP